MYMQTIWEIAITLAGIFGTGTAIYQAAVIRESKLRKRELQYLLAAIHAAVNAKKTGWENQMRYQFEGEKKPVNLELYKCLLKGADEFNEIASLASSLEGAIDTDFSAITDMMDKYLKITEKGAAIQEVVAATKPQDGTI